MKCPKCKSTKSNKNGFIRKEQRYVCLECGLNYTQHTNLNKPHPDSKPPEARKLAHTLYLKGNGFRDIKEILEDTFDITVNVNTIIKWIKKRKET